MNKLIKKIIGFITFIIFIPIIYADNTVLNSFEITTPSNPTPGQEINLNYDVPSEANYQKVTWGEQKIFLNTNAYTENNKYVEGESYSWSVVVCPKNGYEFDDINNITYTLNGFDINDTSIVKNVTKALSKGQNPPCVSLAIAFQTLPGIAHKFLTIPHSENDANVNQDLQLEFSFSVDANLTLQEMGTSSWEDIYTFNVTGGNISTVTIPAETSIITKFYRIRYNNSRTAEFSVNWHNPEKMISNIELTLPEEPYVGSDKIDEYSIPENALYAKSHFNDEKLFIVGAFDSENKYKSNTIYRWQAVVCPKSGYEFDTNINNITFTINGLDINDTSIVNSKTTTVYNGETPSCRGLQIVFKNLFVKHIVSFDMGSVGATQIAQIKVRDGELITEPNEPQVNGYVFKGWFGDSELQNAFNFNTTPITEDRTIYARWEKVQEVTYHIVFDYNGGNHNGKTKEEFDKKPYVLELNTHNILEGITAPNGKEFDYLEINGTRKNLGINYEVNSNTTIKYIWKTKNNGQNTDNNPSNPDTSIILNVPTVNISKGNNNAIILTIEKQENATGYQIYRSTNNKKWDKPINISDNIYTDTKTTYGTKYYYKVKACNPGTCSDYSATVNLTAKPNKVENVHFISAGTNNIKLGWDKLSYTGYEVYMNNKKIATVTKNKTITYNKKKLKANKIYTFKVRAYKTVKGKKKYGDFSDQVVFKTAPGTPKLSVKYAAYKSNTVIPKPVGGATKYIIYRSTNKKKNYSLVGETIDTTNGYTDNALEVGKTYYYKIKACNENGSCSGYSKIASKKIIPDKSTITITSEEEKKVKVEISKVEDSIRYEIYRSTKKKTGYKKVGTASDLENLIFEDKTKSGKTYYYKVRSYVLVGKKKIYSSYSDIKNIKSM